MIYQQEMLIVADTVRRVSGYPVTVEAMMSKTRKREIVVARHVFMYLMRRRKEKFSWRACAGFLGKDHATAVHGYKTVINMLEQKNHLYVGAIQCAQDFNDSMDLTVDALTSARNVEEMEEVKSKMQEAVEAERQRGLEALALVEGKISRIFEVLKECKVQGWVLYKVMNEIQ